MKAPKKTKILLQQALDLDTEARTILLETIEDGTIKSQVETLLADEQQRQQFLKPNQTSKVIESGTLINRIRIIKLLGQGGMGSVYLGFDEKLERQVAIKSIRPEHLKNPATQQRFVREAQILSKINHPSICQLYDYLETPDGDFLVLEYIKGKPLYQVPLTDEQKLTAMADLAGALAVAHEHGIVHRDLKPDNIMITDQGQLKVLDFGIAQSLAKPKAAINDEHQPAADELTQHGSLVGTIRYMSPEQAQGKNIQTASDMYALGIIAQEVFSHQAAYQVMETEQLLADVQQGKRAAVTGLPEPITQLITALTALDPAQRPTATNAVKQIKTIHNAPKLKKKKAIKYSIMVTGVILLSLLFWQWLQFGQQAANNELVKGYENQINALVKQAEQIYMLPLHPVDDEINRVLAEGDELYRDILNDAQLTETAKQRLLGIILLRAEYYADAIPLLEQGQAENQLLADAWTMLYIQKATEFSDQYGMEQTLNDTALKTDYLNPALEYIDRLHQETGQINPLFQAFELSQTTSLEAGLQAVNQILATETWNKEAVNLKALILSASMTQARENGQWQQAKEYALLTAETYQRSTEMARSYPPGYASLCLVNLGLMTDGIQRSGEQVSEFAQQGIDACEKALLLQAENKYPMQLLSSIYIMKAQWQLNTGLDADDALSEARDWNQKASTLNNVFNTSWRQALILAIEAKQLMLSGALAQPTIAEATAVFNNMLKVDSEYRPYLVGDVLFVLALEAQELIRQGQDPTDSFERAQKLFDESLLTPDLMVSEQWGLINHMAGVYWVQLWDQFKREHDILPLAQRLLAFLNPTDNMIKNDPQQLTLLADTHLLLAEYLRRQQQPTTSHIDSAADYITQALAVNPNNQNTLISQAKLMTLQSHFDQQDYRQANEKFQQVIGLNPTNPYHHNAWAESLLIQAQKNQSFELQKAALVQATEQITLALSVDPHNPAFISTQTALQQQAANMGLAFNP